MGCDTPAALPAIQGMAWQATCTANEKELVENVVVHVDFAQNVSESYCRILKWTMQCNKMLQFVVAS